MALSSYGGHAALLIVWSLLRQCISGGPVLAGRPSAASYLSEEAFPGLHIVERAGDEPRLLLYRGGQLPKASGHDPLEVDASQWRTWQEACRDLENLLAIPAREPLQSPWALFDAQGHAIRDLAAFKQLPVAFVLEIGQWMWPAVRVGFEQRAEGVHGGDSPAILRTLSLRPVVFEVREFIAKSEAELVLELGRQEGLHKSQGALQSTDIEKGTQHSEFRTSRQAWLTNDLSSVIAELDERVANLTRVPASHNEPVQLLRYDEGQYYHGHMDWTELELYPDQGDVWLQSHFGHQDRLATVFWYLNDVQHGGETIFPKHGQPICEPESRGGQHVRQCKGAWDPDMASCKKGLKVAPRQGTVILWYNYHPSGRGDRNALHAGCPVGRGLTKWSANKWVRTKPLISPSQWIEGHPAMARYGWAGSMAAPMDPISCMVDFTNNSGETVDLMWYDPGHGSYEKLATIKAGDSLSQQSCHGHQFQLWSADRRSDQVICEMPGARFVLTDAFAVQHLKDALEL